MNEGRDPVEKLVRALSAEEFVDWLVEYKKLPATSADIVKYNLREQFKWRRLQGRLDRHPLLAVLAAMLSMRQSVRALRKPKNTPVLS